jgi:small subunit ribosomal protein S6
LSLRTYEALFIVNPELEDDAIQAVVNAVEQLITGNGGAIVRSEIWGRRRLAYKVKKFTEGCYVLLRFQAEPTFNARLETYFRLQDPIIRYLVTYFDEQMLRLEEEQIKQREEDVRAGGARRGRDDDDDDDDDDRGPRRRRRDEDEDDDEVGVGPRRRHRRDDDD